MTSAFTWPEEGFKEEDITLDFIYYIHGLVGIDGPNEFADMLVLHDLDLYKVFCDRWKEYNESEYWKTKEQKQPW
jgi:hypothetical protein